MYKKRYKTWCFNIVDITTEILTTADALYFLSKRLVTVVCVCVYIYNNLVFYILLHTPLFKDIFLEHFIPLLDH